MGAATVLILSVLILGYVHSQNYEDEFEDNFEEVPPRFNPPSVPSIPITPGCENKVMDIYFILDSSTSIWSEHYKLLHPFVQDVVSRLDISASKTRVGALAYSNRINSFPEALRLNRFNDKASVRNYITLNNFPYMTGITNTFDAIRYVRENQDFRQGVTKVIVVITDGYSSNPGLTIREAELAREQGFYLFVIGLGIYPDEAEWKAVADDPDRDFLHNATTFQFPDTFKNWLTRRACSLPPKPIGGNCAVTGAYASLYYLSGSGTALNSAYLYSNQFVDRTSGDTGFIDVGFSFQNCNNFNVPFGKADQYCPRGAPSTQFPVSTLVNRLKTAASDSRQDRGDNTQVAVIVLDDAGVQAFNEDYIQQLSADGIEVIIVDTSSRGQGSNLRYALLTNDNYIRVANLDQASKLLIERTCDALLRSREVTFNPIY